MKIKANVLRKFLSKITLDGAIQTGLLQFKEEGLYLKLQAANVVFCEGSLCKTAFNEYEAIGDIGIKNNPMFIALINRYGEKLIELKKDENKLKILSETGSTFYVLCDKEMVDNYSEKVPELEQLDTGFTLNSERLDSIKEAADILKVQTTLVIVKENNLVMSVSNDVGDSITEETGVSYKDCAGKYGDFLQKTVSVVEGQVIISLDENYPIQIKEVRPSYSMKYIITPMVSTED